jgi:ribosomal protein S27E
VAKNRPDSLDDLAGISDRMRITCHGCGHSGLYLTRDVIGYFRHKGWSTLFAHAEVRFRCDDCGKRSAWFKAERRPPAPPPIPKPEPLPHPDDRPRGSQRRR